jgi:hypothetical protein
VMGDRGERMAAVSAAMQVGAAAGGAEGGWGRQQGMK